MYGKEVQSKLLFIERVYLLNVYLLNVLGITISILWRLKSIEEFAWVHKVC